MLLREFEFFSRRQVSYLALFEKSCTTLKINSKSCAFGSKLPNSVIASKDLSLRGNPFFTFAIKLWIASLNDENLSRRIYKNTKASKRQAFTKKGE